MYQPTQAVIDNTSFAELLREVNSTIDELSLWREAEKQKEEEFELSLQQKTRKLNTTHNETKKEDEEDLPTALKPHTIDFEKYRLKSQPFAVAAVVIPKQVELPSQPEIDGFKMFEAGHRLTEMLNEFAAESSDVLAGKETVHGSEDWDQLEDIENELRELEHLLDRKPA